MRARSAVSAAGHVLAHPRDYLLARKYRNHSMLPAARFVGNLILARATVGEGDLVECGVWRGGMSAALAEVLPGRRSVLFDSFEGLPPAGPNDGDYAAAFLAAGNTLAAPESAAREAMTMSGSTSFEIRKSWFDETVPKYAAEGPSIAVLRLDGDWYESTMLCLEQLYPLVSPGGLVILDDYHDWEGCRRAVHDYLSRERRTEAIRTFRFGVAHLRKR